MEWEPVIGLEVHTQLATKSKIFSGASCTFGAEPNTQACAVDLALPGVLPVLNGQAVVLAIRFGLSINATIPKRSVFARKNYFYPDLPKGYQISQHDQPIVSQGTLTIVLEDGSEKKIGITRAHLEEDAGKSLHEGMPGVSGIDLNRAGVPLLEIVSEPDLRSAKEAVAYLKTLHNLIRYIGISEANMQEGMFRCDVNVSVRPKGSTKFGTRTELKNLNSFRFIEQAIIYEIQRQIDVLEEGGVIKQETLQYDVQRGVTRPMRSKEEAHDYRYFPDPDLLPVEVDADFIETIRSSLPELPWEKRVRFQKQYQLNTYDANLITLSRETADYFESAVQHADGAAPKIIANWINGELAAALNKENLGIHQSPVRSSQLGALVKRIADGTISNNVAKQVFIALWQGETDPDAVIEKQGLKQITDTSAIESVIDKIIADNPEQVSQYRSGKDKLFAFFVGKVMHATKGKTNPQQVNDLLKKKLSS
jgi:aspartyl-tRNA(Asn)/glutamyl-tRNA(Gln) amidotransferase subunit B